MGAAGGSVIDIITITITITITVVMTDKAVKVSRNSPIQS